MKSSAKTSECLFTRVLRTRTQRVKHSGVAEDGFTLIELLLVLILIPIVIGAVTVALLTTLKATSPFDPQGTAARLADSHDAQLTSAQFVRDVHGAQWVSTSTTSLCPAGGGRQILGLGWKDSSGTAFNVTYGLPSSLGSPPQLIRRFCAGPSAEVDSTVAHDVFSCPATQPTCVQPVTVANGAACGAGNSSCALISSTVYVNSVVGCLDGTVAAPDVTCANNGPIAVVPATGPPATPGLKAIQLTIKENLSGFRYTLIATPREWNAAGTPAGGTSPQAPFVLVGNNPTINVSGQCALLVNGVAAVDNSSAGSINLGNGTLSATGIYTTDTTNPSQSVNGNPGSYPTPVVGGAAIPDPYASLTPPHMPSGAAWPVGDPTANPGYLTYVVPKGWNPSGPLSPGIYIVPNGMSLTGGITSTSGTPGGVLIYVTGGSIGLNGSGNVNLNPLSPPWETSVQPEPVIWVASSDAGATLTLGGNGNTTTLGGAVYAPTATVTLNGGGNNGGLFADQMIATSLSCNGGGAQPLNLTVGSTLVSGTFDLAAKSGPIAPGTGNQAQITVTGAGGLAPTGTVNVYICGPLPSAVPCTSKTTSVGSVTLTKGAAGTSTATSASFTPTSAGTWCFAAYYGGDASYKPSSDTSVDGCFTVSGPPPPTIATPSPPPSCYGTKAKGACVAWGGSITGVATDPGGPGLSKIQVAISDPTGKWWSGAAFVTSAIPIYQTATGTLSWAFSFPTADFPPSDKGSYIIDAIATDTNSVTSLPTQVSFTWNG